MKKYFLVITLLLSIFKGFSQNEYEKVNQDIEKSLEGLFFGNNSEPTLDEEKNSLLKYEQVVAKNVSYTIFISREGYFDIEENYTIVFNRERRGIYRKIFLKYLLNVEEDEVKKEIDEMILDLFFSEKSTRRIEIENIEVEEHKHDVSGNHLFSNKVEIKIGEEDKFITGEHNYKIKYRVRNAFLYRENSVDFYWNFLGGDWDMPFLDVDFKVFLEGGVELDSQMVYLYGGEKGNAEPLQTIYYKTDSIYGYSPLILSPGNDLTLLIHLPLGYIPNPSQSEIFWAQYAWPILPLLCIIIFYLVWYKIGRDKRLIKQVQYYPPENMDSALAGYLMNSNTNKRDIISLIPYFAAQGLLTMEVIKKKGSALLKIVVILINLIVIGGFISSIYFLDKNFRHEFVTDVVLTITVGLTYLIIIFSILYSITKSLWSKTTDMVLYKLKDLPEEIDDYKRTVFYGLFGRKKSVELSSLKNTFYKYFNEAKSEIFEKGQKLGFEKNSNRNVARTITILMLVLVLGGAAIFLFYHWFATFIHVLVCIFLLSQSKIMDKRTSKGDELIKDVLGFRMFVEKAEKSKILSLLEQDPKYFEKTIAYAVAFGMTKKWLKKFKNLVQVPNWYGKDNDLNSFDSLNRMDSVLSSATVSLTSSPSSSSGSGGGSSGGGFGGGGGGSW